MALLRLYCFMSLLGFLLPASITFCKLLLFSASMCHHYSLCDNAMVFLYPLFLGSCEVLLEAHGDELSVLYCFSLSFILEGILAAQDSRQSCSVLVY